MTVIRLFGSERSGWADVVPTVVCQLLRHRPADDPTG
jgi:hypothetical protein